MANDALERSLSAQDQSLERQVSDLNLIVNHLLRRLADAQGRLDSDSERIGRCMALAQSAEALAGQALEDARAAAREELLRVAEAAAGGEGPRHQAPRRDRHGLRLVTGFALIAGAVAAARAVALGAVTLAAAGGIAVAPALQGTGVTDPGARHVRDIDMARHREARRRDHVPAAVPQQRTVTLRRRRDREIAAVSAPPPPLPDPAAVSLMPAAAAGWEH